MSYGHVRYLWNCPNAGLLHYFSEHARKMEKREVIFAFRPITPMQKQRYPGYAIGKLTSRAFWKCDRFLWYHILNQAKIGNKIPKILLLNQKKTPFRAKIPNLEPKYHQYNFWTKNFPFEDEKTEIWNNFQTFWVLGFRSFRVRGFRMFGVHF